MTATGGARPVRQATPDRGGERIAAGPFRAWLESALAALRGEAGMEVPCGGCVGCCTSSYFVRVRPEETRTLAVIPAGLLFDAPGEPPGDRLLPCARGGACPMFDGAGCSIYADRPRACREYDCRIFAAAGIDAGGADKAVINQRVRAWEFSYGSDAERAAHEAVKAAAAFVLAERASFPGGRAPTAPSDVAALALEVHPLFLDPAWRRREPRALARAVVARSRELRRAERRRQ